jgi:class 3 adenylate cyclase/CHASE2 domain-containing sensor protein
MTRIERHLLQRSVLVCLLATLSVIVLDRAGFLVPFERLLYDRRAVEFQFFAPPPTDRLVHLDIDDPSLDAIGAWPWPRTRLSQIIDELRLAGSSALALDVILSEPQQPRYERKNDTPIDDDANLAAAFERFGNVMVPLPFTYDELPTERQRDVRQAIANELTADMELDLEEITRRIARNGKLATSDGPELHREVEDLFAPTRRAVMYDRVFDLLEKEPLSIEQLRKRLLPGLDETITGHALIRLLESQHEKVTAVRTLSRLVPPVPPELSMVLRRRVEIPPIPRFASVAAHTGLLNYMADADGVLRSTPLWVEHKGRLYPQLGLSLACMSLGVDLKDVRISNSRMDIPCLDGKIIRVPLRNRPIRSLGTDGALFMDIPWIGPANHWELMYDPNHRRPEQHLPILRVWQLITLRQRIERNNATLDDAMLHLLDQLNNREPFERFSKANLPAGDWAARAPWVELATKEWGKLATEMPELTLEQLRKSDPAKRTPDETMLIRSLSDLEAIPKRNAELAVDLAKSRGELTKALTGKAVLVGWTATGAAADFLPTSIHAKCPGPVVHGVIFNGILTGELWRFAPPVVTFAVTALLGVCATLVTIFLSPGKSLLGACALGAGYLLINGLWLFDYGNLIVGAAGPLTAIAAVWALGTLYRFVAERRERARIVGRFQNYVDPALVDYVIQNERARFDGEEREMSVVFTDLAGFTTISELLREKTVPILNEYIELMVPVIRSNQGFVNKFLGDGIMFFYGAPVWREDHALLSVMTVLRMQQVMPKFNQSLAERGLPAVKMRAGVASGSMTVGDAGGAGRSDYTVLGDTVNFAARLESANKATGTLVMLSQRTVDLIAPANLFLLRPLGKLQVVGKSQSVSVYEPIALLAEATDEQRKLVELTRTMVELYQASKFQDCLYAVDALDAAFGSSKLATLYRDLCLRFMVEEPGPEFTGQIVLSEK